MSNFLNTRNIKVYIDGVFAAGAERFGFSRSRNMHKIRSCLQNKSADMIDFGSECTLCLENVFLADGNTTFGDKCQIEIVAGKRRIRCTSCFWTKREWNIKDGTAYETWNFICEDWEETAI